VRVLVGAGGQGVVCDVVVSTFDRISCLTWPAPGGGDEGAAAGGALGGLYPGLRGVRLDTFNRRWVG